MRSVGKIYLLSGQIQSGKTSLCLDVIEIARKQEFRLGGVVSPGVFQAREKIAIDLLDIRSGERRRLAESLGEGDPEIATQRWAFRPDAVTWGNQILKNAVPCDLLVIDELGPLEFHRGEGWVNGFKAVASGDFRAALLVIRPSLLDEALGRWDVDRIINLDDSDQPHPSGEEIFRSLIQFG